MALTMTQTTLQYQTNRDLFSNHYLREHLPETEEWGEYSTEELQDAYDEIKSLWDAQKSTVAQRNESQLEEKFIRPMFRKLGIPFEVEESTSRTRRRPDYGFFISEEAGVNAFQRRESGGNFYANAIGVADAKRWDRPLDTRGSGDHERDFENPSYQIHYYLQETDAQWAVLTNGRKWRLYYGPTSHRLDSYYEVDLPTVIEQGDLEDFKYFYLFFSHGAFVPDGGGDCFLDDVYNQSNIFAQELGEDLQDNIYEAIKILSQGFLKYPENDLEEDDLDLIHDSSLIYLYRLIFVLYAEAEGRDLLNTNNEIYEQSYSLNSLKQEIDDELDSADPKYQDWQTNLQSRLDELFMLIDQGSESKGIPKDDLYIPAYNGGLFRTDPDEDDGAEAQFLSEHQVGDSYLAKVIQLLTQSEQNGGGRIFVDYSSLDVRHLGSVYEGLLEYKLNIADEPLALEDGEYVSATTDDSIVVSEGEVYLTTGSGERKATGSYYTPEYVVEYIVENTLGPLVEEIREDLVGQSAFGDRGFAAEFADRVFELKILDPAMGSGHFLTGAIDYLAREIIEAQEKQAAQQGIETVNKDHDINWARRQVAQRCIYGVDLNPLSVELAKVSLWLRTLASEQPLAFLDHHLKTGNSLVGSDITDVLTNENKSKEGGQLTLTQAFSQVRRRTLDHVMDLMQELFSIDNETLDDIKSMEVIYSNIQDDPLYQRLFELVNVHTAEQFGLDVPADAYERMAIAIEDDQLWIDIQQEGWFKSVQALATDQSFFHWEIEYPEVFFDNDGSKLDGSGFDAIIGNPPWGANLYSGMVGYISNTYHLPKSANDTFAVFTKLSKEKLGYNGSIGYILPSGWQTSNKYSIFREWIVVNLRLSCIVNLPYNVFADAYVDSSIFIFTTKNVKNRSVELINYGRKEKVNEINAGATNFCIVDYSKWFSEHLDPENQYEFLSYLDKKELDIEEKIAATGTNLSNLTDVQRGITPFNLSPSKKEDHFEGLDGKLRRYKYEFSGKEYVEYHKNIAEYKPKRYFTGERLILRELISRQFRLQLIFTDEDFVTNKSHQSILISDDRHSIKYLLAILNSNVLSYYHVRRSAVALRDDFPKIVLAETRSLPVPEVTFEKETSIKFREYPIKSIRISNRSVVCESNNREDKFVIGKNTKTHDLLDFLAEQMMELNQQHNNLNSFLLDHLGSYKTGSALIETGLKQPAHSLANSILHETATDRKNLRIGSAKVIRESLNEVEIQLRARYKPENKDSHETDRWGYTETELLPAIRISELTETEADLIEHFVPVAVDEAGGFANFRETATKTNSLIDRLNKLTLPAISDVEDELANYIETVERAEKLEEKIQQTDDLIDEIVYELYGLTDEEIAIVEDSVVDN